MRFSVLMSVYYKEKPEYLKLALDSIINQTLPVTEIVLIKDGPLTAELDKVVEHVCHGIYRIIRHFCFRAKP